MASEPYVEVDRELRLLGSRCQACTLTTYPAQRGCPGCGAETMERRILADRGTLWSYTVQYFAPKPADGGPSDPTAFEPYGVGYVELRDGVIVEARLTENDPERLEIGMAMELADPRTGAPGASAPIGSLRFQPVDAESGRA